MPAAQRASLFLYHPYNLKPDPKSFYRKAGTKFAGNFRLRDVC
jgi:hypothetical protein